MRKAGLKIAVSAAAILLVGGAFIAMNEDSPVQKEEYTVVNEEQDDYSPDLEEPVIDGDPPKSAADYVRDSREGSAQTVKRPLVPLSGPSVSGEGWTATHE